MHVCAQWLMWVLDMALRSACESMPCNLAGVRIIRIWMWQTRWAGRMTGTCGMWECTQMSVCVELSLQSAYGTCASMPMGVCIIHVQMWWYAGQGIPG